MQERYSNFIFAGVFLFATVTILTVMFLPHTEQEEISGTTSASATTSLLQPQTKTANLIAKNAPLVRGDFNRDGSVDNQDITECINALVDERTFRKTALLHDDNNFLSVTDLDQDGKFTEKDLDILRNVTSMQKGISSTALPSAATDKIAPERLLLPGTDRTAIVTQNPDAAGNTEKTIAQWDAVPFQTISGTFRIGVVAFHHSGIDRVEFSAFGGKPVIVKEASINPRTGVSEYWIALNADDFPDGDLPLRATAYAVNGVTRELTPLPLQIVRHTQDLPLYVSPNGSDENEGSETHPLKTIAAAIDKVHDGGKIILNDKGTYPFTSARINPNLSNNRRWITILARPGLDRSEVLIAPEQRTRILPHIRLLRWQGVTFDFKTISQYYPDNNQHVWFNHCRWIDSAGWLAKHPAPHLAPIRTLQYIGGSYVTDCIAENMLYGFVEQSLVRNCTARRISGDVFQNSLFVVNSIIDTVDGTLLEHHSDLFQYFGHMENLIVYNVSAFGIRQTQNFFFGHKKSSFTNCAFVNVMVENSDSGPTLCQLSSDCVNVLFAHISNPGQSWIFREDHQIDGKFTAVNVSFVNCILEKMTRQPLIPGLPSGVTVTSCNFSTTLPTAESGRQGQVRIIPISTRGFMYTGLGAANLQHNGTVIPGFVNHGSGKPNIGAWVLNPIK